MSQFSEPRFSAKTRLFDRTTAPHIVTLVLIAGSSSITQNVFLPSLPAMATYFEADYAVMQLAISAYLALTGLLQLIIGPLADRYGRRPVLIGCFTIYLLATLGCIFAPNETVFLGFRMAQAVIVAGTVLSRAIVRDIVPGDKAASMLGYVTMGMAMLPMVAPMIGGLLETYFDWRMSFALLLVLAALVLVLFYFDLPETNPNKNASFAGQFRQYPALLASRRFWGYAATSAFAAGCFFTLLGGAPYVATQVLGMSPIAMGMSFGTISFGFMSGNFASGRFATRFGVQRMIFAGTLVTAFGIILALLLFLAGFGSPVALFAPMILVGFGNGLVLPSSQVGMLSINPKLAGSAAGLGGALMIGGGAVLSAVTGALLAPGLGAYPLILMMLFSALMSIAAAHLTRRVEAAIAAK